MKSPRIDRHIRPIKSHIDNFKRLSLWLLALGLMPPFIVLYAQIGPPWPHRSGVAYFTTVLLWVVILWTHASWQGSSQKKLKKLINRCVIATLISFICFSIMQARFVENAPTAQNQVAKGFFLKPEWREVLKNGEFPDGTPFPVTSELDLLKANEWKAQIIWPSWTVTIVRITLLASWLGMFGGVGALTSIFLLLQEKKTSKLKK